jgi:hypothetical protein
MPTFGLILENMGLSHIHLAVNRGNERASSEHFFKLFRRKINNLRNVAKSLSTIFLRLIAMVKR